MTEAIEAAEQDVDLLTEKDLYKIMGVSRGAKLDDIKKAYRKLSLKYHPDKNQNDPDATVIFQKIAEACSILSDPKKRLKYDKSGDMDLEDFDMDQFMNIWVGEMMEEGGMVDEMMNSVLPWTDDDDKMKQFMEEKIKSKGKKTVCQLCQHTASTKRLMITHFEQKHKWECEDWATETLHGMKASFESFMKQITGIGDASGKFVLPDGTSADMSKVKGVPDIRQHMQGKVDKAKEEDAIKEMYRKLDMEESIFPTVEELCKVLKVEAAEAEQLREDKEKLLRRLRKEIDRLNEEEDEEAAMMEAMGGLEGLGGLGGGFPGGGFPGGGFPGKGGGKGGLAGLLGAMGGGDDMGGLEGMLDDPAMLEAMMSQMMGGGGMGDLEGLLGGMGGFGGKGGMPPGMGGFGKGGGAGMPGMGARASREPVKEEGPRQDIGCKCGYSCGTIKALEKHLAKFKGDPAHESQITERAPSPIRIPADNQGDLLRDLPPEVAERLGLTGAGGMGLDDLPPGMAERLAKLGGAGLGAGPGARSGGAGDGSLQCLCGYTSGTVSALKKHIDRFPGDPKHAVKC